MKNAKMLFLLSTIIVSNFCFAGEEEQDKVKELGLLDHYGAHCCKQLCQGCEELPQECKEKLWSIEVVASTMTQSQILAASQYKVDGKTAIEVARSQDCEYCNLWADMLEDSLDETEFMVNELGAGHLTKKELLANDQLAKKLRDFDHTRVLRQLKNNEPRISLEDLFELGW